MTPLFITLHKEGALLEEAPTDSSIEVTLPEEEMLTLRSLMQLDSYRVAKALGSLVMFSIQQGHSASRRSHAVQPNS